MEDITADTLAEIFIQMRDAKAEIVAKSDAEVKAIELQMDQLSDAMNDMCKAVGADSIKTAHGTIIRSIKERIWPAQKDVFAEFVRDTGEVNLLEMRVHQGNMKEYMKENGDVLPPGLNIDRKYEVTVRRSSK